MNILADFLYKPTQTNSPQVKKSGRGIYIKSPQEVETMRQAAKIVATVLKEISELVQPGMTTADLDAYAEKRIREMGATPVLRDIMDFRLLFVLRLIMKLFMVFLTVERSFVPGMF